MLDNYNKSISKTCYWEQSYTWFISATSFTSVLWFLR